MKTEDFWGMQADGSKWAYAVDVTREVERRVTHQRSVVGFKSFLMLFPGHFLMKLVWSCS
jgi:hypothetical protein